mmetsp:Transcript_24242/g.27099  ORF Transcript_24242/g.27099 Transcript_24242/m.27099 type:complete len:466 (+) Transcript_24242:67-1464(+)
MITRTAICISKLLLLCFCSVMMVEAFLSNHVPLATSLAVIDVRERGSFISFSSKMETKTALFSSNNNPVEYEFALLFDCDGVILETEELHRKAYNSAFDKAGVKIVSSRVVTGNSNLAISEDPVLWSVEYYDILQNSIGGGKPKMRHYFKEILNNISNNDNGRDDVGIIDVKITALESLEINSNDLDTREGIEKLDILIDELQAIKTKLYKKTVETDARTRPGVLALMDEAIQSKSVAVGVCSASTKEAALKVLDVTLGPDRVRSLDVCILGDDVSEKKPSPMIYNEARKLLGITNSKKCVVIEDSAVGLRAAKSANMLCIITYTDSTAAEDFYELGADAKVPNLRSSGQVTLDSIFDPMRDGNWKLNPELLVDIRDGIDSFESIPVPVMINNNTGAVTLLDELTECNDEEYNEKTTVAAPIVDIIQMDTKGGIVVSVPNRQQSAQPNTPRKLRLYEDDMGNFST